MHLEIRAQITRTPRSTYTMPSGAFEACSACVRHPGGFHIIMFESGPGF